ncbi:hypothetical protein BTRA_5018 [Burkholderia thailandensis USAMRU Malaysia |uniref:hypothetical protein n=1 Tax=Burkholderia thailandensis TaxID=57975 RepID=UPI0003134525|nr:hypothetical protein [Burkholderia thailandensis]AIC90917.1 hypothetical protein BTRA_5018 [Burkholderia thailandensis USAMRU Malaysia \
MTRRSLAVLICAAAAAMPLRAAAAGDADAASDATNAALDLADATPVAAPETARPWKFSVQNAVRWSDVRDAASSWRNQLVLEFQFERALTPTLGVNFAMRFDRFDPLSSGAASHRDVTLVKEAYASWKPSPLLAIDAGRINERIGAAIGYNPTDFFKAGAVSLDVPPDPDSRHANRLGSVAVRAQRVWDSGSIALMLSPRLASRSMPGDPFASSDLQRTNGVDRWMLVGSQRIAPAIQPQWVLYGESGQSPQFGQNLSVLLGNAVVAYAEWTGGWRPSLIGSATGGGNGDRAFRTRSAVGFTWTLPVDLSLTAELQGNSGGASASQWRALQASDPYAWGRAVRASIAAQELPSRHGLFLMAAWRNVFVRRLDLTGFAQLDLGAGRQYWLELRRRFDTFDVAVQFLRQTGPAWSRFGAMPEASSVQVLGIFYQ